MMRNFSRNRIEELRIANNITQRQLAKGINTSQANVSRWESGAVEPSISVCWQLADFFDVTIDFLCGREDD